MYHKMTLCRRHTVDMTHLTSSIFYCGGVLAVTTRNVKVLVVGVSPTEPRVPMLEWWETFVITADTGGNQSRPPAIQCGHDVTESLPAVVSFRRTIAKLSIARLPRQTPSCPRGLRYLIVSRSCNENSEREWTRQEGIASSKNNTSQSREGGTTRRWSSQVRQHSMSELS